MQYFTIAGFIAQNLNLKFSCNECQKLLLAAADPSEDTFISIKKINFDLVYPSDDVANLCIYYTRGANFSPFFEQAQTNMINKNIHGLENLIKAAKSNLPRLNI
jgi:hypothetical protein